MSLYQCTCYSTSPNIGPSHAGLVEAQQSAELEKLREELFNRAVELQKLREDLTNKTARLEELEEEVTDRAAEFEKTKEELSNGIIAVNSKSCCGCVPLDKFPFQSRCD